jgi:predicted aldo/keto reductase-like oxidoreductase
MGGGFGVKYRKFGRLGWESSILGLGVMKPPIAQGSEPVRIDEGETIRIIRSAIDRGVNFLDLGFPWDMRQHEALTGVVRKALAEGYRQKVKVSLTIPAYLVRSQGDFSLLLERQLRWLGADGVEFCLLGRLNRDNWPRLRKLGALAWIEDGIRNGLFDAGGFSFHDHYQVLRSILSDYDRWTLASFQYSYMDVDHDPGVSGINLAAQRGLAVVVTEPLRGGRLTAEPPEVVAGVLARAPRKRTLAEWGLRFVWNHGAVSSVVCDMSSMAQLEENLKTADEAEADSLTVGEEVLISEVREGYRTLRRVPCPSCRPCMPCPQGIDVPRFFEVYNDAAMYGDIETARSICRHEQLDPGACTECGLCESRCAKRLPIIDWLTRAREFLGAAPIS